MTFGQTEFLSFNAINEYKDVYPIVSYVDKAVSIYMIVVPIRHLMRTSVVPIRIFIRTRGQLSKHISIDFQDNFIFNSILTLTISQDPFCTSDIVWPLTDQITQTNIMFTGIHMYFPLLKIQL